MRQISEDQTQNQKHSKKNKKAKKTKKTLSINHDKNKYRTQICQSQTTGKVTHCIRKSYETGFRTFGMDSTCTRSNVQTKKIKSTN